MDDLSTLREALKSKHPRYRHWEIFKMLEADLRNVSRYIDISPNNFSTHSAELSALILRICTEIETLRKRMTKTTDNRKAVFALCSMYPDIAEFKVALPLWGLVFQPWHAVPANKPEWWVAYEAIKHDKTNASSAGNLRHFLDSFSGLYALMLFYDRLVYGVVDEPANKPRSREYIMFDHDVVVGDYFEPCLDHVSRVRDTWTGRYMVIWDFTPKAKGV